MRLTNGAFQRAAANRSNAACDMLFTPLEGTLVSPPTHQEIFSTSALILDFLSQGFFQREPKIYQMTMSRIGHGKKAFKHTRWEHSLDVALIAYRAARLRGFDHEDSTYAALVGAAHDIGHIPGGHSLEITTRRFKKDFGVEFYHDDNAIRIVSTDPEILRWFDEASIQGKNGEALRLNYRRFVACLVPDEYIDNTTNMSRMGELERFLYRDESPPKLFFDLQNEEDRNLAKDPIIRILSRIAHDDSDVTSYLLLDQRNSHYGLSESGTFAQTPQILGEYFKALLELQGNSSISDVRSIINFYELFGRHYSLVTFNSSSLIAQSFVDVEASSNPGEINLRELITGDVGDDEFFGKLNFPMLKILLKQGATDLYPVRILLSFKGFERHELRNIEDCLTLSVAEHNSPHNFSSVLPGMLLLKRASMDRGHEFTIKRINDESGVPIGSGIEYHCPSNTFKTYLTRLDYPVGPHAAEERVIIGARLTNLWQIAVSDPGSVSLLLRTISQLIETENDPRITIKVVGPKDRRIQPEG